MITKLYTEKSEIQSILFPTSSFSVAQAKSWANKHGFKSGDVDEKSEFIHLRQTEPKQYDHYATLEKGKGIKFRVGYK